MKLLIDIPEHIYEHAKERSEDSRDEGEAMRAIANGTQQESRSENPNTCGDAISREELIEALNTWDKFGYAPTNELIPLRGNVDKDKYVPYIHYDDVIKCIKGMSSVTPEPCEDAISRQAVLDAFWKLDVKLSPTAIWTIQNMVKDVPSVTPQQRKTQMLDESNFDVNQYEMDLQSAYDCGRASTQQRTGRWIEVIDETDSLGNKTWHHECSICGSDKSGWGTYKHCPDCGAKMEVEKENG